MKGCGGSSGKKSGAAPAPPKKSFGTGTGYATPAKTKAGLTGKKK